MQNDVLQKNVSRYKLNPESGCDRFCVGGHAEMLRGHERIGSG